MPVPVHSLEKGCFSQLSKLIHCVFQFLNKLRQGHLCARRSQLHEAPAIVGAAYAEDTRISATDGRVLGLN